MFLPATMSPCLSQLSRLPDPPVSRLPYRRKMPLIYSRPQGLASLKSPCTDIHIFNAAMTRAAAAPNSPVFIRPIRHV